MRPKLFFLILLASWVPLISPESKLGIAADTAGKAGQALGAVNALGSLATGEANVGQVAEHLAENAAKSNPYTGAVFDTVKDLKDGKVPFDGIKQGLKLIPNQVAPPGVMRGVKIGVDVLDKLVSGENVFKIAGDVIEEFVNPTKLVKNLASEVLGDFGGDVVGGVFDFVGDIFGGLFGGSGIPSIPDDLNPVKQGTKLFEKALSGNFQDAVDGVLDFAKKQGDVDQLMDSFNKAKDVFNSKNPLSDLAKNIPILEDSIDKLSPLLNMDLDGAIKGLGKYSDLVNLVDTDDLAKKIGIPGIEEALSNLDSLNLKSLGLPLSMDDFLKDPFSPNGVYGKNGLYGMAGKYGPNGFFGPNDLTGPFGPNGLFGPNGPKGINGLFGPNGALGPGGLLKKVAKVKLPFLENPLTAKNLANTPFGKLGSHGINGLFGPNGPYGPFGDFGPSGLFGPDGPFGPNAPEQITQFLDKIPKGKKNCQAKWDEILNNLKNKDLLKPLKDILDKKVKDQLGKLKDKVKKGLEKGKDLMKKLDDLKKKFPKFPKPNPVEKIKDMLKDLKKIKDLVGNATDIPNLIKDKLRKVGSCLAMPPSPGIGALDQIQNLPGKFKLLENPLQDVSSTLRLIKSQGNVADKIGGFKNILGKIENAKNGNGNFDFLKSKDFVDAGNFINGLKMSFDGMEQPSNIMNVIQDVGGSDGVINKVKGFINGVKLGGPGCENKELKNDAGLLRTLGNAVEKVEDVKEDGTIEKVIDVYNITQKFIEHVEHVNETFNNFVDDVKNSLESRDVFKFFEENSPEITETVIGLHALSELVKLYELKEEVKTVINAKRTIREAVKYVKEPVKKVILDVTWKKFNRTSRKLTKIMKKIETLEKIVEEMTNKTLESQKELIELNESQETKELIYIFIKAAGMNFTQKINLKRYKESMKLFDNSTMQIREVRDLSNALMKVERHTSAINWRTLDMDLRRMPDRLVSVQSKGEAEALVNKEEATDYWWLIWLIVGICVTIACSLVCLIVLFFWYRDHHVEEEPPYTCPDELMRFSYVQMQDARFEWNQQDKDGKTELFKAVQDQKWFKVSDLLEQGALVDATCGPHLRTALFETTLAQDAEHSRELLEAGAYTLQPDVTGKYPDQWSDQPGFLLMFDEFNGAGQRRRIIPPNTPRPYDILVVNPDCLTRKQKKKIPKRIKKKITWGYKEEMDLNKFTHIVVPPKYSEKENTLHLENDDLFIWRCVASLSNIMPESWLEACIRSENYVEDDHVYMLTDCDYAGAIHEDALLKLKTDMHMGRPKFLKNVKITLLETKDPKEANKKSEWEEIFKSLGAEISAVPVLDDKDTLLPYNSLYPYKKDDKKVQNSCWILKYEDSKVEDAWTKDKEKCTVAPFRFVLECVARYHILPIDNSILKGGGKEKLN